MSALQDANGSQTVNDLELPRRNPTLITVNLNNTPYLKIAHSTDRLVPSRTSPAVSNCPQPFKRCGKVSNVLFIDHFQRSLE
jgi:hypothetical protein